VSASSPSTLTTTTTTVFTSHQLQETSTITTSTALTTATTEIKIQLTSPSTLTTSATALSSGKLNSQLPVINDLNNEWIATTKKSIKDFLVKLKPEMKSLALPSAMFSYVADVAIQKLESVMNEVKTYLCEIGIQVEEEKFTTLEKLDTQLKHSYSHAIVFCTRAYADCANKQNALDPTSAKSTKRILGDFSETKADALHVLLCEGGFGDTAMKVVEGNILVRSYHDVFSFDQEKRKKLPPFIDPEEVRLQSFIDHFLNYSSFNNGLGILPSLLGLTATENDQYYDRLHKAV